MGGGPECQGSAGKPFCRPRRDGALPMIAVSLHLAMIACGIAAFLGGFILIHPSGLAGALGLGETGPNLRAMGGALLLAHAAALATLAESSGIGACMAAGLGTAWFGAAAGRAIAALVERKPRPRVLAWAAAEALMGLLLWAPLWGYLKLIRRAATPGDV